MASPLDLPLPLELTLALPLAKTVALEVRGFHWPCHWPSNWTCPLTSEWSGHWSAIGYRWQSKLQKQYGLALANPSPAICPGIGPAIGPYSVPGNSQIDPATGPATGPAGPAIGMGLPLSINITKIQQTKLGFKQLITYPLFGCFRGCVNSIAGVLMAPRSDGPRKVGRGVGGERGVLDIKTQVQ